MGWIGSAIQLAKTNFMHGLKSAILVIFQNAWLGWSALLVRPSRIPHMISKIIFSLGAGEFLATLED